MPADPDWLARWRAADERAAEAILGALGGQALSASRSSPRALGVLLPAEATLFVAASMPVREIESFWPVRDDAPRVLCNRGANGIDGTSRARSAPPRPSDGPVVALIGDVALAHDIGGLLAARRLGLTLTIVLIDNGGGGDLRLPACRADRAPRPTRATSTSEPHRDADRPRLRRRRARSTG